MGCIMKGYYEDEDKYECLCKRVGVKSLPDSLEDKIVNIKQEIEEFK